MFLMLAVVAGSIGWATRDQEAQRAEVDLERSVRAAGIELEVNRAIANAQQLQAQSKWPEAMAAAQRARGLLAGTEINSELLERIDDLESDLSTVLLLEEIRDRPVQSHYASGVELEERYSKVFARAASTSRCWSRGRPRNEFAAEAFASSWP